MHSSIPDRRTNPRLQFELPIVFSGEEETRGITRDVSQGGVYFYTDAPLNIGNAMEFKVLMPGHGGKTTRALCNGTVVRIESGNRTAIHRSGVAVRITSIQLV